MAWNIYQRNKSYLLYNIQLLIYNIVFCTYKFAKKIDIMLRVLITHIHIHTHN